MTKWVNLHIRLPGRHPIFNKRMRKIIKTDPKGLGDLLGLNIIKSYFAYVPGMEAGPGAGLVGRMSAGRGDWLKSKSFIKFPSMGTFSRTVGRGSGRPSVLGSMR